MGVDELSQEEVTLGPAVGRDWRFGTRQCSKSPGKEEPEKENAKGKSEKSEKNQRRVRAPDRGAELSGKEGEDRGGQKQERAQKVKTEQQPLGFAK